ncbi:NAD-dependent epimerase/dehydratase family protein [uncultured Paraglaciecola sp.]|uniref:NAD-dependent epimerase/dehydratase family protein n=1 Tax=uncultured Paraglaciecola sp. TaxID=1765024 RepID=UPI00259135B4|nr:NAD-dependent epimerase/dehydratase family protein [uncultured Paraglaciecola sp.]
MKISIVGCGWLGQPLALRLKDCGHNIVATSRSEQKCQALSKMGLEAIKFELGDNLNAAALSPIFSSQILILNIPVGRKSVTHDSFTQGIQSFLERARKAQINKVLFVSTTSVYGGEDKVVTEQSPTMPETLSGKINLAIESIVTKQFPSSSAIMRLSGLVNSDRHPAKYLAGKVDLQSPNAKVNLIHQEDVIKAIELVIDKALWGQTFHLSALIHPTRKDYYTWSAAQLGLPEPSFIDCDTPPAGKEINANQSLKELGLTLKYPSPYDMIG